MPGLYVHIPYCIRKCLYCDFPSYHGREGELQAYLRALFTEIDFRAGERDWGTFSTVFIGGGTPSLLDAPAMQALLQHLQSRFSIADIAEVTVECNPGTLSQEKLQGYLAAGVNRLSIGIQSVDDRLLQRIGRIHTGEEAIRAVEYARAAGFSNINVDLMHGLPAQSELDYLSSVQEIARLMPTHISAYALILEEGTPLYAAAKRKEIQLPDEEESAIMQDIGDAMLATYGYLRYEISNYSLPGFTCKHNVNYWENGPYLGLGAAAHSAWRFENGWTRFENTKDTGAYCAAPAAVCTYTAIPREEEAFESVMLGLRMTNGVSLSAFAQRYGVGLASAYPGAVARLIDDGWLIIEGDHARLSARGLDMQNTALQFFLSEGAQF